MSVQNTKNDYILRLKTHFGVEMADKEFCQVLSDPKILAEVFGKVFGTIFGEKSSRRVSGGLQSQQSQTRRILSEFQDTNSGYREVIEAQSGQNDTSKTSGSLQEEKEAFKSNLEANDTNYSNNDASKPQLSPQDRQYRMEALQSLFLELPDAEVGEFCMQQLEGLVNFSEEAAINIADVICCLWDERNEGQSVQLAEKKESDLERLQSKFAAITKQMEELKAQNSQMKQKLAGYDSLQFAHQILENKLQTQLAEFNTIRAQMSQLERENASYLKHTTKQQQELKVLNVKLQELNVKSQGIEACMKSQSVQLINANERIASLERTEKEYQLLQAELTALHVETNGFQKGIKQLLFEIFSKTLNGEDNEQQELVNKFDPSGTRKINIEDIQALFGQIVVINKQHILKTQNHLDFLERKNEAMLHDLQIEQDKNEHLNANYQTLFKQFEQEQKEKLQLLRDKSRYKHENQKLLDKLNEIVKKKLQLLSSVQNASQTQFQLRQLVDAAVAAVNAKSEDSTKNSISSITMSIRALSEFKSQLQHIKSQKQQDEEIIMKKEQIVNTLQTHIDNLEATLHSLRGKNNEIDAQNQQLIRQIEQIYQQKDEFHGLIQEMKQDYNKMLVENQQLLYKLTIERETNHEQEIQWKEAEQIQQQLQDQQQKQYNELQYFILQNQELMYEKDKIIENSQKQQAVIKLIAQYLNYDLDKPIDLDVLIQTITELQGFNQCKELEIQKLNSQVESLKLCIKNLQNAAETKNSLKYANIVLCLRHLLQKYSDDEIIPTVQQILNNTNIINKENDILRAQIMQLSDTLEHMAADINYQYSQDEIASLHKFIENVLDILLDKYGQKMTTYWFYKESRRNSLIDFLLRDQIAIELKNLMNEQQNTNNIQNFYSDIILKLEERIYKLQELLIKEIYQRVKSQFYLNKKGMQVHVTYEDCLNMVRDNQIDENRIDEVIRDFIVQIKKQPQVTRKQKL